MPKPITYFKNFLGGWNCDAELTSEELRKADNIDLLPDGGIASRQGITPLNATAYSGKVLRMDQWKLDDDSFIIMGVYFLGNTYYLVRIDSNNGELTQVCTLNSGDVGLEYQDGNLYFVDGAKFRYYDRYDVHDVQLPKPSAAPALSGSGTGGFSGTFSGKVTYVNIVGAESEDSAAVTYSAAGFAQFDWSSIPTGPSGTVKRRLYRTKTNSDVFYYVAEIPDNFTTTYSEGIPDEDLTVLMTLDNRLTAVSRCKYLLRHPKSTRFYAAGDYDNPRKLYWSEPNQPGYWRDTSEYQPNPGEGPIYGLDLFDDGVLVKYDSTLYGYRGVDPEQDTLWGPLPISHGCRVDLASAQTPGSFSFLSHEGVWCINTAAYTFNVSLAENKSLIRNLCERKVTKEIREITNKNVSRMVWDAPRQRLLFAYTTDTGQATVANKILVLHWGIGGGWTRYTGIDVYDFCLTKDDTLLVSSGDTIYRMYQGNDDNTVGIDMEFETAYVDFGNPLQRKRLSRVFLVAESSDNHAALELTVSNGIKEIPVRDMELYSGRTWDDITTWGDSFTWPSTEIITKERQCYADGQRFKLNIKHSEDIDADMYGVGVKIFGIGFEYKGYEVKGDRNS